VAEQNTINAKHAAMLLELKRKRKRGRAAIRNELIAAGIKNGLFMAAP